MIMKLGNLLLIGLGVGAGVLIAKKYAAQAAAPPALAPTVQAAIAPTVTTADATPSGQPAVVVDGYAYDDNPDWGWTQPTWGGRAWGGGWGRGGGGHHHGGGHGHGGGHH